MADLRLAPLHAPHILWSPAPNITSQGGAFSTIHGSTGASIRYKNISSSAFCETTPGVPSIAGFIDLSPDEHMWFWYFGSRSNASADPVTLWLNGGPGSDSNIGLFQEIGPCTVLSTLDTRLNVDSWSSTSNLLILSQPVGVGFSHSTWEDGVIDPGTGVFQPSAERNGSGRLYPTIHEDARVSRTSEAAVAAWNAVHTFYTALRPLGLETVSDNLNIFTESYGGHYGPAFARYFKKQSDYLRQIDREATTFQVCTLGIVNGMVDLAIQVASYIDYLRSEPFGIKAVNSTMLDYMEFALRRPGGCMEYLRACAETDRGQQAGMTICSQAATLCRSDVETIYQFSERHPYDIREPSSDGTGTPPDHFLTFLNQPETQRSLGLDDGGQGIHYADNNQEIYWFFAASGDLAYPDFLDSLVWLLDAGVVVALAYGDADYECNWMGGEAIADAAAKRSKASEKVQDKPYRPFEVDGVTYGVTREAGNLSFTRIFDAGHKVPWYQPKAMRKWFERAISKSTELDNRCTWPL